MADITLGELAVRYGLTLRGDPARRVDHVATLSGAGPGSVAFLANPAMDFITGQVLLVDGGKSLGGGMGI